MNYLAHLYLSHHDDGLLVGNFIGDHVANKDLRLLPKSICSGVQMHRAIDQFTDTHPITRRLRSSLFKEYRHRSRVIVDLFYDHFLAYDFESISGNPLTDFSQKVQNVLHKYISQMPLSAQRYLIAMERHNWLNQYASLEGLEAILEMMSRRKNMSNMGHSVEILSKDYTFYRSSFYDFFDDLQTHF
jgi:acyl carrier protein phosphodiesterase